MRQLTKFLTIMTLLSGLNAYSQTSSILTATQENDANNSSDGHLGHTITAAFDSGISNEPGEKINKTAGFLYTTSYVPNRKLSLIFRTGVTAELTGIERETVLNNSLFLANFNNLYQNDYGVFSINSNVTLPTNKDTRDFTSLYTRVSGGVNWVFKLPSNIFFRLRSNLNRSFHEYNSGTSGSSNIQYSLSHSALLAYSFNDKVSVSAIFSNTHLWSYIGRRPDVFGMSQDISYSFTKGSTVSVGHQIQDHTFRDDGKASNFKLFDDRASSVYVAFTQSF